MNFHLSWACIDKAPIIGSWYTCHNLVKLLSTEIFAAWVVFMKAIFLCLNLKLDEGLLPYSMPEVFNKTGHGLTDIIIAWDDFKPVLHPDLFWTPRYIKLLCVRLMFISIPFVGCCPVKLLSLSSRVTLRLDDCQVELLSVG